MTASPREILDRWLTKYELYQEVDRTDADQLRFYVDLMSDGQRRRLIGWLRDRRVSYIESACHEGGDVLFRFEAFRSHLRAMTRADEHDVPA